MPWKAALLGALLFVPLAGAQSPDSAADTLPDGEGKKILLAACTTCHDLGEVTKFRGYFGRDEWRDIVRTMVQYGAQVNDKDVEVLVEYLVTHLGKQTP